jgi:hypothetical protein
MDPATAFAVGQGAAGVVGGAMQGYGQWKGAKAAQKEIGKAIEANEADLQQQLAVQQPYQQEGWKGTQAFSQAALSGDPYKPMQSYNMSQFGGVNLNEDPSYQFRLNEGLKGVSASAAGKGALKSGATLKALQNYGQQAASQEYANAYGRQYGQWKDTETMKQDIYNKERDYLSDLERFRMGDLKDLSQIGQTAATQMSGDMGAATAREMEMRGAKADAAATRAAGPWATMGASITGAGNTAGQAYKTYSMGKK